MLNTRAFWVFVGFLVVFSVSGCVSFGGKSTRIAECESFLKDTDLKKRDARMAQCMKNGGY